MLESVVNWQARLLMGRVIEASLEITEQEGVIVAVRPELARIKLDPKSGLRYLIPIVRND